MQGPCSPPLREYAPMGDRNLTQQQLRKAFSDNKIAAAVAIGGVIRFVFHGGTESGYLVQGDGTIRRFDSDAKGQYLLETKIRKTV